MENLRVHLPASLPPNRKAIITGICRTKKSDFFVFLQQQLIFQKK